MQGKKIKSKTILIFEKVIQEKFEYKFIIFI